MANTITVGNVLGDIRAEADKEMLDVAFLETTEYKALRDTDNYNFVVGRRGTGKSAIFIKLKEHWQFNKAIKLLTLSITEHDSITAQEYLKKFGSDYRMMRAASRVAWKHTILLEILYQLKNNYKINKFEERTSIDNYLNKYKAIHLSDITSKLCNNLEMYLAKCGQVPTIGDFVNFHKITDLDKIIKILIDFLGIRVIFIMDGLDEGWYPDVTATAFLGGLSTAVSEISTIFKNTIYPVIFLRDNIARAIAHLDSDHSRNIEGSTLRLHWSDNSLLHLVAERLRHAFDFKNIENDIKVWNRFAQKGLSNREGFKSCLHHTLYRPRDVLTLLNQSYIYATKESRTAIVDEDIQAIANSISTNRLNDLHKEYGIVLPGIKEFTALFSGFSSESTIGETLNLLQSGIDTVTYQDPSERDFAIFSSPEQILYALYSVGFIGIHNNKENTYIFCHDGSTAKEINHDKSARTIIHPCYWEALGCARASNIDEVSVQIDDAYESSANKEIPELRTKRIGQIISELPSIKNGRDGAFEFEKWCHTAICVLFLGPLANVELKPNSDGISRRDIVATNQAEHGFWKRLLEDYRARQVIFEVKNYEEVSIDDFRQSLSYLSDHYGTIGFIITRTENERPSDKELGYTKEYYSQHHKLIVTIPAISLAKYMSKVRSHRKKNYAEEKLSKRLDTYIRSYLSLRHEKSKNKAEDQK